MKQHAYRLPSLHAELAVICSRYVLIHCHCPMGCLILHKRKQAISKLRTLAHKQTASRATNEPIIYLLESGGHLR